MDDVLEAAALFGGPRSRHSVFQVGASCFARARLAMANLAIAGIAVVVFSSLPHASASAQDVEYGEYLSSQCTTCHQISGMDNGIPPIIGWDAQSFIAVMGSYKRRERENKVMQNIADGLGDEEVEALAAYFATIQPKD